IRIPDFTPCWPGLESSLHLESSDRRALYRNKSVPSLRASLHFGPMYRATIAILCNASDPAPLRRSAPVVRYRGHVGDARDLEAKRIERAHRGFTSGSRTLDPHFQILYTTFLGRPARRFGSHLRREGRRFARALEAGAARCCPRQRVALPIGNRDDRIVERRVNVRDSFRYALLDLLARARDRAGLLGGLLCHRIVLSGLRRGRLVE